MEDISVDQPARELLGLAHTAAESQLSRSFTLTLGDGARDLTVAIPEDASRRFREAMSRWASGITVVTVRDGDVVRGITASSFSSLSLTPPLVMVAIAEGKAILEHLLKGRFTINLLAERQRPLAEAFAHRRQLNAPPTLLEDAVIEGSLAAAVCTLWQNYPGGDHRILVGEVERIWLGATDAPLLYFARDYRTLQRDRDASPIHQP